MKKRYSCLWLACLFVLGSFSMAHAVVVKKISAAKQEKAIAYWTPERMKNAKPLPMAVAGAPAAMSSREAGDVGEPGAVPGSPSGISVLLSEEMSDPLSLTGAFESNEVTAAAALPYPPPQTTFFVSPTLYGTTSSKFPFRAIGKVFFTVNGAGAYCSGSSVGGRAVLLAGHCVAPGDGFNWYSNFVFVPAYRNGAKPYGSWAGTPYTTNEWFDNGEFGRDVAFLITKDNSDVKLSKKVGALGFAWNARRDITWRWNEFGYSAAKPYIGQWMVQTYAPLSFIDGSTVPPANGTGTRQTPGSSGGPWILDFSYKNYANGVNSYFYTIRPLEMFSPYFDTAIADFWLQMISL